MCASSTLFLFDIDGTLVRLGGAGRRAMNAAFSKLFGQEDAFAAVDFRGSVDSETVDVVFQRWGVPVSEGRMEEFKVLYLDLLAHGLDPTGRADQWVCPGVPALLEGLRPHGTLGLVTGNWRGGAEIKLRTFGLWPAFTLGAFGEDARQRSDLVRLAIARARAQGLPCQRVIMVGDTVQDVEAAQAAGAVAVAVCTGWTPRHELAAAGPEVLLTDLDAALPALLQAPPAAGGDRQGAGTNSAE